MRTVFFLIIMCSLICCKTHNLEVTIENDYTGKAYLYNTKTTKTDTIAMSANRFSIDLIYSKEPTLYYLIFEGINDMSYPISLVLSDQQTQVAFKALKKVDIQSQNIKDLYPNRPQFASDPNRNEAFYHFLDLWVAFSNNVMNPKLNLIERKGLYNDFINQSEIIIKKNKHSVISAFITEYLMRNNLIQLEQTQHFYELLEPQVQLSTLGQKIKREVGFEENTKAPSFSITDYRGDQYSLEKLKGRKVLLHFWSSTCAPCIKETPQLLRLAEENKELVIINVSLDIDKEKWISAMEKFGIVNMINHCDLNGPNGQLASDFQIKSIPANYLIDEEGNIQLKRQHLPEIIKEL
ncbi:TlpA family protein disulfide reductase [Sediminitomix flava]|uniref:Thiol-disulfide isomerase/thioredoxin n=1 Tax=Sediminitomix flava TaxID=379075 RepID=A0A315ZET2_SEDFL|nr:TlpA disulfide reductase family protein [Sediminitomix flava]PWJ43234.1 thiol-disulfide isomerase/thioredoxin [Sediminitomix flava]